MTEKIIIFDSGALISFSMNGLIYQIRKLKEIFKGKFLITSDVKREIIDKPLTIKRFELEAMKLRQLLDEKILEMPESVGINSNNLSKLTDEVLTNANKLFSGSKGPIKIIDSGEASCIALSNLLNQKKVQNIIVVDERTTRLLIEKPENLKNLLQKRMHINVNMSSQNQKYFKGYKIIRSTELIYVAYKKGLIKIKDKNILDALLYALKFKGCAISNEEISQIKKLG